MEDHDTWIERRVRRASLPLVELAAGLLLAGDGPPVAAGLARRRIIALTRISSVTSGRSQVSGALSPPIDWATSTSRSSFR